ncbi:MAG TPA: rod shape-determining protein MreC [Candidatus Methylacidiphilales bacterium]|nr:rod shape-determining protein MreC [Candidatus Methylacidiphilales bacterium]
MNKSTYFLVVLGIGSALILACFLLPDQVAQSLRNGMQKVFSPVLRTADKPVSFLNRMDSKLKTLDEAQAEVTRLRQQVAELTVENQVLTDKTAENARLREMLGFRAASPYRLRACRVISREPDSWWNTVQVNVGWRDDPDLAKDQPVVSPRGVVGKTGNVSPDTTEVILMLSPNCSISAFVEGTHDHGVVTGQGNFEEGKPRVMMNYLSKDSEVSPGEFIVTSGLGPYFPAGLRLGTVLEVPPLNNGYPTFGLYREAVIEPTADLNRLDELFIVLGPKQGEGQAKPENGKGDASPAPDANPAPDAGAGGGNQ